MSCKSLLLVGIQLKVLFFSKRKAASNSSEQLVEHLIVKVKFYSLF